jgi:hypothetical protein
MFLDESEPTPYQAWQYFKLSFSYVITPVNMIPPTDKASLRNDRKGSVSEITYYYPPFNLTLPMEGNGVLFFTQDLAAVHRQPRSSSDH